MSLPAQNAIFSIAPQSAKVGEGGTFDISSHTWRRFRAPRIGVRPMQSQKTMPPETGGPIVPNGSYKDYAFYGGDVDLFPRLEEDFGYLLYGAMGAASTVTVNAATGTYYEHHFRFSSDSFTIPWLAARTWRPGVTGADEFGEAGFDCKISGLRLVAPAMGLISMNIAMQGRNFVCEEQPSWVYNDVAEDSTTVPISGNGSFKLGGTSYPSMGLTLELDNGLTTPQQEAIVGSLHPDDAVPLSRATTFRLIYKYENPDLFQKIYANSASGTAFDPQPFILDTAGATYAMEMVFKAAKDMPGISPAKKYQLAVRGDRIALAAGQRQLQAGNLIVEEYIGTLLEPASGGSYLDFVLTNLVPSYSWT